MAAVKMPHGPLQTVTAEHPSATPATKPADKLGAGE